MSSRPPSPFDEFKTTLWDTFSNLIYIAGVIVIELVVRPLFGDKGFPLLTNITLTLGDLVLIVSLLNKLLNNSENCVTSVQRIWRNVAGKNEGEANEDDHDDD